jgi:hypothetical protein
LEIAKKFNQAGQALMGGSAFMTMTEKQGILPSMETSKGRCRICRSEFSKNN